MITSMLEKAIEIEGLLRIIRDGEPLPETYKLLNAKTESLAAEVLSLSAEADSPATAAETPKAETPQADFIMAPPAVAAVPPKVDFTAPMAITNVQPLILPKEAVAELSASPADMTEVDLDLEEEDDIILSFDDITDTTLTAEATFETPKDDETVNEEEKPKDDDIVMEEDAGNTEDAVKEEEVSLKEEEFSLKEEETQETLSLAEATETAVESAPTPKRPIKLKSAFSLNDRFLYARELFNGNMKIFDSTLDHIEGIGDYALTEDYLYNELGWNPENTNVMSFMEILRPQFK